MNASLSIGLKGKRLKKEFGGGGVYLVWVYETLLSCSYKKKVLCLGVSVNFSSGYSDIR